MIPKSQDFCLNFGITTYNVFYTIPRPLLVPRRLNPTSIQQDRNGIHRLRLDMALGI